MQRAFLLWSFFVNNPTLPFPNLFCCPDSPFLCANQILPSTFWKMEPNLCPCLKIAFSFPIECSDQTSSCLCPQLKLSNTFVKIHILAFTALTKACLFFFSAKTEDKKFKKNFQLCRYNYNREAVQLIFGRCIKEFDTPCHVFSLNRQVFYALGTMLFYIWLQTIQNAPHC